MSSHEHYEFESGIEVSFETELGKQYATELRAFQDQAGLDVFVSRWGYLCTELRGKPFRFETLKALVADHALQSEYVDRANKGDSDAVHHLNLLLPLTMFQITSKGRQFGVPDGVVVLQLLNARGVEIDDEGFWTIHWKGFASN